MINGKNWAKFFVLVARVFRSGEYASRTVHCTQWTAAEHVLYRFAGTCELSFCYFEKCGQAGYPVENFLMRIYKSEQMYVYI